MAVDIRHLFAGVLTFALFAMLINMIKTDYFDSPIVKVPESFVFDKVPEQNLANLTRLNKRRLGGAIKPCWTWPSHNDWEESKGFITFSLTRGPEYHVLQVANAVLVARHLGAALVLPDIIGDKPGDKRNFEDIYDVHRFVASLNGVVKIADMLPADMSEQMPTLVMVPHGASEHYITSEIEPLFKQNGNLKLVLYFPTSTVKNVERMKYVNSVSCLAVFKALRLQVGLKEVVDSMLESIRTLSQNPDALFVAVDFRVEMLQAKGCLEKIANGRKKCYGAQEIGQFLKKIGFPRDTILYFSQNGWDKSLDALKDIYPNTYTKESLMPTTKVARSIISEISLAKIIDFHMCFGSDVFVPALHNLFQAYVVGARIASDKKTATLVPSEANSVEAVEYMSPYITKKTHPVYSCFC